MIKILSIFGTRPEAIKMAPVLKALEKHPGEISSVTCVTAQHREMLDQVLTVFAIKPDYDLDIMQPGQDLFYSTGRILMELQKVIDDCMPDLVLVQGDTTTSMAAALASYYAHARVGHIEAGLRTQNKFAPFPEEMNRRITGVIADLHFAPTPQARQNLLDEGVDPESIYVTGNTVVDALFAALALIEKGSDHRDRFARDFSYLDPGKKLVLVTGHRRENFGKGFENICMALARIAKNHPEVQILYPVHLNPNVQKPVRNILGTLEGKNIFLIDPVEYLPFVFLMNRSHIIVTDSGGIQEEAPSLGKPVLVMRDVTERPEGVQAGVVKIVGTEADRVFSSIEQLLSDESEYRKMTSAGNPYGDGKAVERIIEVILSSKVEARPE